VRAERLPAMIRRSGHARTCNHRGGGRAACEEDFNRTRCVALLHVWERVGVRAARSPAFRRSSPPPSPKRSGRELAMFQLTRICRQHDDRRAPQRMHSWVSGPRQFFEISGIAENATHYPARQTLYRTLKSSVMPCEFMACARCA
jgi:hypothetical protein